MVKKPTELKRGDVIVGLDGHPTPFPIKVTEYVETIDNGPGNVPTAHIKVEQHLIACSPDRYLPYKTVEYARWVTLAGHRLLKRGEDVYVDPETGYEVYRDDTHETWCDDQHPVKLTYAQARAILDNPREWCWDAQQAAECIVHSNGRNYDGKRVRGYLCPGGEIHTYSQWIAWDPNKDHNDFGQWSDTPTEAASYLPAKETV
jgi:hypothetical protein